MTEMNQMDAEIAEAERMQRWDYAAFLRMQKGVAPAPQPEPTAAPEGGDVAPVEEAPPTETEQP